MLLGLKSHPQTRALLVLIKRTPQFQLPASSPPSLTRILFSQGLETQLSVEHLHLPSLKVLGATMEHRGAEGFPGGRLGRWGTLGMTQRDGKEQWEPAKLGGLWGKCPWERDCSVEALGCVPVQDAGLPPQAHALPAILCSHRR